MKVIIAAKNNEECSICGNRIVLMASDTIRLTLDFAITNSSNIVLEQEVNLFCSDDCKKRASQMRARIDAQRLLT